MYMLVDLQTAKQALRYDDSFEDADEIIARNILQASAIVLDYLKITTPPVPVPLFVEAATVLSVQALFDGGDPLNETVRALLHRFRDPALA